MQRRLIVMRHAKSAWDSEAASDHDRPLNKRGRRDAPRIAAHLRQIGWTPERVISSDSARTRQTWELMAEVLGGDIGVSFTRELYLAGIDSVRAALGPIADTVCTAMVLGHNPGWEQVVLVLTGQMRPLGTCTGALLVVDASSWSEAAHLDRRWQLHDVVRPAER
jgi:phosphohistidine phosphatase